MHLSFFVFQGLLESNKSPTTKKFPRRKKPRSFQPDPSKRKKRPKPFRSVPRPPNVHAKPSKKRNMSKVTNIKTEETQGWNYF